MKDQYKSWWVCDTVLEAAIKGSATAFVIFVAVVAVVVSIVH